MAEASTLERLAGLALFADLSRAELEAVVHSFEDEVFEPGRRVLRHGIGGGSVYVILDGEAVVLIDGAEVRTLGRGEAFGEISALTGDRPSADVVARTVLRCFVIPAATLQEFLLEHPTVMLRLLKSVVRRLQTSGSWRD